MVSDISKLKIKHIDCMCQHSRRSNISSYVSCTPEIHTNGKCKGKRMWAMLCKTSQHKTKRKCETRMGLSIEKRDWRDGTLIVCVATFELALVNTAAASLFICVTDTTYSKLHLIVLVTSSHFRIFEMSIRNIIAWYFSVSYPDGFVVCAFELIDRSFDSPTSAYNSTVGMSTFETGVFQFCSIIIETINRSKYCIMHGSTMTCQFWKLWEQWDSYSDEWMEWKPKWKSVGVYSYWSDAQLWKGKKMIRNNAA